MLSIFTPSINAAISLISARQGNSYAANTYLKDAISKDASLATYAENDLEFNNVK